MEHVKCTYMYMGASIDTAENSEVVTSHWRGRGERVWAQDYSNELADKQKQTNCKVVLDLVSAPHHHLPTCTPTRSSHCHPSTGCPTW